MPPTPRLRSTVLVLLPASLWPAALPASGADAGEAPKIDAFGFIRGQVSYRNGLNPSESIDLVDLLRARLRHRCFHRLLHFGRLPLKSIHRAALLPILALSGLTLLDAPAAHAQARNPRLVADLEVGESSYGLQIPWIGEHRGAVFLAAGSYPEGTELVRLEGDRFRILTDLCAGSCNAFSNSIDNDPEEVERHFAFFGDDLFFVPKSIFDDPVPHNLWKVALDGSQAVPVTSWPADRPTVLGDRLLFNRSEGFNRWSLWSWDGQALRRIQDAETRRPDIVPVGSRAFLYDGEFSNGRLFVTDGTSARQIAEISGGIFDLYPVGERALIHTSSQRELWISDGTEAGTRAWQTFERGAGYLGVVAGRAVLRLSTEDFFGRRLWIRGLEQAAGTYLPPHCTTGCTNARQETLTTADGSIFLVGDGDPAGDPFAKGFWRTDGTAAGTYRVAPKSPDYEPFDAREVMDVAGNQAYFIARADNGRELWASDGSPDGAVKIRDLPYSSQLLGAAGSRMVFSTYDFETESGTVWTTDGTLAGTRELPAVPPGGLRSATFGRRLGDDLLLVLVDADHSRHLWRTDGTAGGTRPLDPSSIVGRSSWPEELTPVGEHLFLTAVSESERRVFRSRGTAATTERVGFGLPEDPKILGAFDDQRILVFGRGQVWITDGTEAGTDRLAELDTFFDYRVHMERFGGHTWIVEESSDGTLLWITDGTFLGTRPELEIDGLEDHRERWIAAGRLFLIPPFSSEFWSTDGTEAGTARWDLEHYPFDAQVFGDRLIFHQNQSLWTSDGTPEGTGPLLSADEVPGVTFFHNLQAGESVIYFTSSVPGARELWLTDGTAAGTRKAGVLPTCSECGSSSTDFATRATVGDRIFFAWDGRNDDGRELWTASPDSPPQRLQDVCAGPCDGEIRNLQPIGDRLYFSASDGVHGLEPWVSDGTPAGTYRLADVAEGASSSDPSGFLEFQGEIYFPAVEREHGFELRAIDPASGGASSLLADSRFEVGVRWRTSEGEGGGRMEPFSDDTSFFWFFGAENIELVVKILDGRALNDHYWVFWGALSDVEYWIDVRDRRSGEVYTFHNPPGRPCGGGDTLTLPGPLPFPVAGDQALPATSPAPRTTPSLGSPAKTTCGDGTGALCLRDGRFRVEVAWNDGNGGSGPGRGIDGTDESGYFWFFDPSNVELAVKVLDGRPLNGRFWVFYGALSDVEYTLTVTDTSTGQQSVYQNPAGEICGFFDTSAF